MQCRCPHQLPIRGAVRAFSSSTRRPLGLQLKINDEDLIKDTIPAWPHGPTRLYKQAAQGLYGGRRIRFGNNTSEENRKKTRRTWHPNVRTPRIYSKALDRSIHLKVTARVMRTIDKVGGLDEYILGEKEARIKELGEAGWALRWILMQTPAVKERYAKQRAELGLPPIEDSIAQAAKESAEGAENVTYGLPKKHVQAKKPNHDKKQPPPPPKLKQTNIRFRLDRNKYVEVSDSGVVVDVKTQRSLLKEGLKRLSPTASLKYWEEPWNQEEGLVEQQFLAARNKLYKQFVEAYRVATPFEPAYLDALPADVKNYLENYESEEAATQQRKEAFELAEAQARATQQAARLEALAPRAPVEE